MRRTLRYAGLAALGLALGRAPADASTGADAAPGPRARTPSAGAARVSTFEALRELVARPDGPAQIELEPGIYRGDLVIKRSLALLGGTDVVLEGTGSGTVVTIDASDVAIEDVVVRRSGHRHTVEDGGIRATGERNRISRVRVEDTLFGVALHACHGCVLESAHIVGASEDDTELRGDGIKLWESHDSLVRGCLVERSRDVVVWYTKRALLMENVVRKSRYGSHFMYAHDSRVRRSRFEDDVVGVFVMYSMRLEVEDNVMAGARGAAGVGLGFKDSDSVQVRRNWLVANTTGVYLDNTPRAPSEVVSFEGNVLALNDVALRLHSSEKGLRVHGNDFRNDATTIEVDGGGDALGVDVRGNHFSDYEGYDLDGDGVGDVAHEVKMLSSALADKHPSLKLFHSTPAMAAIDAVALAVPVFASRKLLVDPAPLVRSPEVKLP